MTDIPVVANWVGEVRAYSAYIALAFAGSFLRASQWQDEHGKVMWFRVFTEIPTAVAVGAIAVGIGQYFHLEPKIIGGLCGVLGLLGPAFFRAAGDSILEIVKSRLSK